MLQGLIFNNRLVAYNYLESPGSQVPGGIWYTSTEGRTSWMDAKIYPKPYATSYGSTETGTFPTIQGVTGLGATTYFEHEVGNNQINTDGSSTAITSFVKSYEFDLEGQGSEGDLDQRSLDLAYQDFLAKQQFPFKMLNFALGALQGIPYETLTRQQARPRHCIYGK